MTPREACLAAPLDPPQKIDGIGFDVYAKTFTAADADAWEYELSNRRGANDSFNMMGLRAALVRIGAADESNACIFTDADLPMLGKMPAALVTKIYKAIQSHNDLLGDVEETKKN